MKDISLENERLEALLKFKKKLRENCIIAKVVARDPSDWRSAVIINRGEKDGIRRNMPCATSKGLVGSVIEVSSSSSKVMLIADPNSRVGVILEPSRESGLLVGSPEAKCKIIYLSPDAKIEEGDRVLTAGFSTLFPKGLAVGKVGKTGLEKTNLYKYAFVVPFEKMERIEEVICIDIKK